MYFIWTSIWRMEIETGKQSREKCSERGKRVATNCSKETVHAEKKRVEERMKGEKIENRE